MSSDPNQPAGDNVGQDKITVGGIDGSTAAIGAGASVNITHNYAPPQGEREPEPTDLPKGDKSPYLGMEYYREEDKDRFFGREAVTAELVTRLTSKNTKKDVSGIGFPETLPNFLPIIGVSGSGKSSLVRAGIVPELRRRGWEIRVIVPTAHPLKSLATALSSQKGERLDLIDRMERGDERILDIAVQDFHVANTPFLLVIDQFEELFTTLPKLLDPNDENGKQQRNAAKRVRQQFLNNLFYALRTSPLTTVIITLRADFLAYCFDYAQLRDALEEKPKLLAAMDQAELIRAIRLPAEQLQYTFAEGLVDTILRDCGVVNAGDAADAGVLPLLSHALDQMWEHGDSRALTLEAYEAAGRVQGAIAKTAESTYQALRVPDKAHARHIFTQLTELGEGSEDTRRRVPLADLIGTDEQRRELLTHLMNERLITTHDDEMVSVTHEALIREWGRLREWVDEDRESLRLQRRITADTAEWIASGRDATLLYHGTRLQRALDWLSETSREAFPQERQFIETSQQQAVQETKRRTRRTFQVLIGMLGLTILASFFALQANSRAADARNSEATSIVNQQVAQTEATNAAISLVAAEAAQSEAERQAKISLGLSLAALAPQQADDETGEDDELATLLALEASRLNRDAEGDINGYVDRVLRLLLTQPYFAATVKWHSGGVNSVAFSSDGKSLASTNNDQTVRLWNVENPDADPIVFDGYSGSMYAVAFSPDGKSLASASSDRTVRLWDVENPDADPIVFDGHSGSVVAP